MSVSPYPPVFTPNPANEHVSGSRPLLPPPYSSSVQAAPGQNPGYVTSDQYNAAMQKVMDAINAANGFDREKFVAQYQDLQKARDNALQLENLRDQTSRYGVDAQSATALRQLQENARQYDSTHALDLQRFGLDQQKFGLDYANAYTNYTMTPDRYAQADTFVQAAGRALQGLGQQPYGSNTTFTAKTPEDFAALAGYAPPGTPMSGAQVQQGGAGTGAVPDGGSGQGPAPDPRTKAMKAIIDAVPPSSDPGMNHNDWAVMNAAKALYSTNLGPGVYQKMSPGNKAILGSYVTQSGRYLPDWQAQQVRQGVGQGSASAYA